MNRCGSSALRTGALIILLLLGGCSAVPHAFDDAARSRQREARFLLLGEVHDNPQHHALRAALLTELPADGRPTTIVFEQMSRDSDAAIRTAPRSAEAIADAGRLDRKAWRWPAHKPLLDAALDASARIAGGNLERAEVRAIVREGRSAVPPDLRPMLDDPAWDPDLQRALEREIDAGHCHALPAAQLPVMALAQRARDAAMAQALLSAAEASGRAVLLAGNGHVRLDLGVPRYLRAAGVPTAQIVAVGYLEEPGPTGVYDLAQLTRGVPRDDPCAAFENSR
jgi:uncharacterized iron-regulated protein